MTLKVRLATIMILLLLGVLALQFVLASREQQELARRISELSNEVNASSRELAILAHAAEGRAPFDVTRTTTLRTTGEHPDSQRVAFSRHSFSLRPANLVVEAVYSDSATRHFPAALRESTMIRVVDLGRDTTITITDIAGRPRKAIASAIVCEDSTAMNAFSWTENPDSMLAASGLASVLDDLERRLPGSGQRDIQIMFPFPSAATDSITFVEMRYPTDTLTEALASARRRSLLWLTSLLGVGVIGATLLAGQFTRPIRKLERSFRQVESGDLSVEVVPERDDEIGRLTSSFNHMVGRLRETQSMERRLAEAEREAAMGRLAAGVAHEVRNPLNAIQLNLQQMRDKAAPAAGTAERENFDRYASTVSSEVKRLESVVGAFLDLSRAEAVHTQSMNVSESVRAAVELFQADAASREVTLTVRADGDEFIDGDPTRLPMVWNNLLANALDATPAGGRVEAVVTREGDDVIVTISDTGSGMHEEAQSRMWDPFFSGRPDGTGLGLSIVRSVTERHGGSVRADSAPDSGTRVVVTLPAPGGET